jgi:thiosulfate/3-mercaptopyruvate sulfurtransferase
MISENDFTSIMQSLNIDNRHTLVFYDDQMSLFASRAWWLARYFGFPKEQLKV